MDRHPIICQARGDYQAAEMRRQLQTETSYSANSIVPYLVFPFDMRFLYYETAGRLLNRRRPELWENLQNNEFLIAVPEPRKVSESRPLFARCLFDLHLHDRGSVGFPAQVTARAATPDLFNPQAAAPIPHANLGERFWQAISERWSLRGGLEGEDARRFSRQLIRVSLAVCHSPSYQEEHKESLAQDWAHIPIPKTAELFGELATAGELVATLLDPTADARTAIRSVISDPGNLAVLTSTNGRAVQRRDLLVSIPHFSGSRGGWRARRVDEPDSISNGGDNEAIGDLHISDSVSFGNVPERVWRYELGGYPVLKKWLGYRDARRRSNEPLTLVEKDHLREIVQRIASLIALNSRLDELYERVSSNAWTRQELGLD